MAARWTSKDTAFTLVSHVGAYGGIATHLNHFVSALRQHGRMEHAWLLRVGEVPDAAIIRDAEGPDLCVLDATNHVFEHAGPLRPIQAPLGFLRELWLGLRRRGVRGRHLVLTSHDPNGFWGFVLLARHAAYMLFVLPQPARGGLAGVAAEAWRGLVRRIVQQRLRDGRLSLFAPTHEAAAIWAAQIGVPRERITAIPHPPFLAVPRETVLRDLQAGSPEVARLLAIAAGGRKLVLSVGHLEEYKGARIWLEAARRASRENEDLLFVWVGDGPLGEEFRSSVDRFDFVSLPGRMNQTDLRALYAVSWVFFHPALKESQGIVVVDALSFGVPVILNDREALPGLIAGTEAGFVIDFQTSEGGERFVDALSRLRMLSVHDHMAAEARRLAVERFSYEAWVCRLGALTSAPSD